MRQRPGTAPAPKLHAEGSTVCTPVSLALVLHVQVQAQHDVLAACALLRIWPWSSLVSRGAALQQTQKDEVICTLGQRLLHSCTGL